MQHPDLPTEANFGREDKHRSPLWLAHTQPQHLKAKGASSVEFALHVPPPHIVPSRKALPSQFELWRGQSWRGRGFALVLREYIPSVWGWATGPAAEVAAQGLFSRLT